MEKEWKKIPLCVFFFIKKQLCIAQKLCEDRALYSLSRASSCSAATKEMPDLHSLYPCCFEVSLYYVILCQAHIWLRRL